MPLFKSPKLVKLEENMQDQLREHMTDEEAFSLAKFDEKEVERVGYSNYSYWRSTFQVFRKNKIASFLVYLVLAILLFTFVQPYLPNQRDPFIANNDTVSGKPLRNIQPGEKGFIFGTNSIGQDLWSRLWAATRTSLIIAISVAAIEALVGILAGVLWGYVKACDLIFTELYNILDNIPSSLVLILVSYMLTPGIGTIIFAMSITRWIGMARFIRNQIVIIRDREYNLASRCLGTGTFTIIFRNLLPYLVSVIMLRVALAIPEAIGSEVFITYIGLGLPATTPSLGNLINLGRQLMLSPNLRYQLIYPTVILSIVTIAFYVVGNAFSDAADPKNHR
jgi:ABC-type dipeptide/oligopeptide/nickel transport systems, permease components